MKIKYEMVQHITHRIRALCWRVGDLGDMLVALPTDYMFDLVFTVDLLS